VADITYIRLQAEFRLPGLWFWMVIREGWSGGSWTALSHSRLAIEALQGAIASRRPPPGLVHHSIVAFQYASAEYVAILTGHGMVSSMSRPANPYDNASCESFIKTLKREEIYANDYSTLEQLREQVEEFIGAYYNQQAVALCSRLLYAARVRAKIRQRRRGSVTLSDSRVLAEKLRKILPTGMLEEGTQNAVPSPDPIPAWRINKMTVAEIQRSNLSHARMSHVKGSKPKRCGVATENCLNDGVHSTRL